jgi:hypothetical protein
MKQNEKLKIGNFYVLIAVALLVTSVAVAVSLAQPAPYPGAGPTPTPGPTPAPGAGGPAPYPTAAPTPTPTPTPGTLPDLVVSYKQEEFVDGQVIVHYTVTNNGDAEAGASTAGKYLNDHAEDTDNVPRLGPGASYDGTFDPEPCPPGETFTVRVCADIYEVIDESDETNNCMTNEFTCPEGPLPGGPDLVIEKEVEIFEAGSNCFFNVRATVTNIGNEVARASDTGLYVDGVFADTRWTERLGPGASDEVAFMWQDCPCGTINITVCADDYNVVTESNETNNCAINIRECQVADIEVIKEVWDPWLGRWVDETDNVAFDDNVLFRCIVHNSGCCCDLTDIVITDVLSDSLEYLWVVAGPDPDSVTDFTDGRTELRWNLPGPLEPCEDVTIRILAHVIDCGEDTNTQTAVAMSCTGVPVSDSDTATVNVARVASLVVTKEVFDPVAGAWVNHIDVPICTDVLFRSTVHNDGCCDLTDVEVLDELDLLFDNIWGYWPPPVITPWPWGTSVYWSPGTLARGETITYFIEAHAAGPAGVGTNTQDAWGYCAETNTWAFDWDDATVRMA